MDIKCTDGKNRNCRVPGRFKRTMWLKLGYIVLVEPWPDNDDKGEIIFNYNPGAVNQLRKRGLLNGLQGGF
jgi:translation initiation factor 1A